MARNIRSFRPTAETLEGRQLLSNLAPIGRPGPTPWTSPISLQTSFNSETGGWVERAQFTVSKSQAYVVDFSIVATVPTNQYYGYLSGYSVNLFGSNLAPSSSGAISIGDGTVTNVSENIQSNVSSGVNGGTVGYYTEGSNSSPDGSKLPLGEIYLTAGSTYTLEFAQGGNQTISDFAVSNIQFFAVS